MPCNPLPRAHFAPRDGNLWRTFGRIGLLVSELSIPDGPTIPSAGPAV